MGVTDTINSTNSWKRCINRGASLIYKVPDVGQEETNAIEKIAELRRQLRYYVATEPRRWFGSVRRVLAARAIQGSNSIEGFNVSVEDAVAAVEGGEPTEASWTDWHAVNGYRRAMTYVLQLAHDEHFEYSPSLIRSLHFMMTEYSQEASPGLWRPGPIWVRNDSTGEVVYEGPEAEVVPTLVEELTVQLAADLDIDPMIRAAMAHLNLVMIHPFRDGNGRISRCLQTLVLARGQILAAEWCSIEEYLGRNTDAYYKILSSVGRRSWAPEHDARPWIQFCLEAHYVQAASVLRRVRESERMWIEIERLAQRHHLPERAIPALFDATIGLRVRNSSYRASLRDWDDISNQVATTDLRAMVRAGLLRRLGVKRGTYYEAASPLVELRKQVREGRQSIDVSSLFMAEA